MVHVVLVDNGHMVHVVLVDDEHVVHVVLVDDDTWYQISQGLPSAVESSVMRRLSRPRHPSVHSCRRPSFVVIRS